MGMEGIPKASAREAGFGGNVFVLSFVLAQLGKPLVDALVA